MAADEKARAIDLALAQIEKQFGKGSIMRLGSKEAIVPISVISTGAISFDAALGVGGGEILAAGIASGKQRGVMHGDLIVAAGAAGVPTEGKIRGLRVALARSVA